jgi:hypothetical protein
MRGWRGSSWGDRVALRCCRTQAGGAGGPLPGARAELRERAAALLAALEEQLVGGVLQWWWWWLQCRVRS